MSTSHLYHAYNLKGVKYQSTEYKGNEIILKAEMTEVLAKCPVCGSKEVIYKGKKERRLRLPPSGQKTIFLLLLIHRLFCKSCGALRWPHLPFAPGKQTYTSSFAIFVLNLLDHCTIKSVAQIVGVSWDPRGEYH